MSKFAISNAAMVVEDSILYLSTREVVGCGGGAKSWLGKGSTVEAPANKYGVTGQMILNLGNSLIFFTLKLVTLHKDYRGQGP